MHPFQESVNENHINGSRKNQDKSHMKQTYFLAGEKWHVWLHNPLSLGPLLFPQHYGADPALNSMWVKSVGFVWV